MTNMEWIAQGNTGCTFATLFARKPEAIKWLEITHTQFSKWKSEYGDSLVMSITFPDHWQARDVRKWALAHTEMDNEWFASQHKVFYEEEVDDECLGLRINMCNPHKRRDNSETAPAWIQYFGPDSHVVTRQAPHPMLMWTRKLNPAGFVKQVGWNGILHLAHAFSSHITQKMADTLWKRSYEQVKRKIGHTPTIKEAAKTTWLKTNVL